MLLDSVDVEYCNAGNAVEMALKAGNIECVKMLITKGADCTPVQRGDILEAVVNTSWAEDETRELEVLKLAVELGAKAKVLLAAVMLR